LKPKKIYHLKLGWMGIRYQISFSVIMVFICFWGTGAWTQGLHLESLQQRFFVMAFFWDRVSRTICPGWLWTRILLISASWVARITGMTTSAQLIV
jgi:hypothetical protein